MDELSRDKYGIAWAGLAHAKGKRGVKAIALSITSNGPFIQCNEQTVRDRTYPLTRNIYLQLNRPPNTPIEPRLKEFLLFVLSREGQNIVSAQGEYLPLTADELNRQRRALD
jgi:phosphate transport system substrate-binding protein